jgi:predicted DNA-binding protein
VTRDGSALLKKLRSRKNAYLARRLRELPDEDVAALERAAEVLERLLDGERR